MISDQRIKIFALRRDCLWYIDVNLLPSVNEVFRRVAQKISAVMGSSWAFICALLLVLGWAVCGPFFDYSTNWQLFINTGTTILTFLMVFLIQNTQNRDSKALHLKVDELIYKTKSARNKLIDLEDLPDEELDKLQRQFSKIQKAQQIRRKKVKIVRKMEEKIKKIV